MVKYAGRVIPSEQGIWNGRANSPREQKSRTMDAPHSQWGENHEHEVSMSQAVTGLVIRTWGKRLH